MYARARPGPGEFTAASGSISAVATTASGAVAAVAAAAAAGAADADADAGSSGLLGAGASAAVLSKLSSSTIHGNISRRFGFLGGSSCTYNKVRYARFLRRKAEGADVWRNGVGEGGEGSGGQLFVGGGCLCGSLRCRIVLRDCVVFDHPLGSSSWLV